MIDPIALGQNKEYIAIQDRNEDGSIKENATKWIIGPLDAMQKALITAHCAEEDPQVIEDPEGKKTVRVSAESIVKQDFEIVRQGLKGFSNFGSLEFKTDKVKFFNKEIDVLVEKILLNIPIVRELADVIWDENIVDEKLAKN